MLGRQVVQALRVYFTHMTFWVWVGLFAVWHFGTLQMPLGGELGLGFLVFAHAAFAYEIGRTLAAQFADPRARLFPGFAKAHLMAAGALVAASLSMIVLIGIVRRAPLLGGLSLCFAATGVAILIPVGKGLTEHRSFLARGAWSLGILGVVLMALVGYLDSLLSPSVTDYRLNLLLGCTGLAAIVAASVRLARLSEDSPGYYAMADGSDWDTEVTATGDEQTKERAKQAAYRPNAGSFSDRMFSIVLRRLPKSGRMRHLLLFHLASRPPYFAFLITMGIIALWLLFGHGRGWNPGESLRAGERLVLCAVPLCFAIASVSKAAVRRRGFLSFEWLLPLDRIGFVREMDLANTIRMLVAAATHFLLLSAVILVRGIDIHFGVGSAWLAVILSQYMVGYKLVFLVSSFGPSCLGEIVLVIAALGLSGATTAILGYTTTEVPWHFGTVMAVVVSALAALGLHRLGCCRWRHIDLDE
ncbi:MAG: hypothetical protein U1E05_21755 [Patescibacteria group bacterium]|nr:hypothetical protein [Patescibacteria group bacterium]